MKIKYVIYIIIFILVGILVSIQIKNQAKEILSPQINMVAINGQKIKVEIADDQYETTQGLSDRQSLCEDCGMLFVFPDKAVRSFWMKNMRFPIDIIWIDDDKIVKIDKNLAPEGENPLNTYSSEVPVNNVLEVNAGFADKNNIKLSDYIKKVN